MTDLIMISLFITGAISLASLLWFSFRLVQHYIGPSERRIKSRMQHLLGSVQRGPHFNVKEGDGIFSKLALLANIQEAKFIEWLEFQISKSGISMSAGNFILISLIVGVLALITMYFVSNSATFAIFIAFIVCLLPYIVLEVLIHRRQALLERELPDLLDFMARSLQVGHSFNTTLQMAANEAPMPLSAEFTHVFEELNFGASVDKVLAELCGRIQCAEIRYFSIAVIVNREIGGDLAEILKRVSKLIRDRMEFKEGIRVLSSEGKASALILGALPFLVGGLIFYLNPWSLDLMLNDSLGRNLLLYAGLLMAFGFFWMNRLCDVKA
jgi:tight adherence protein B